MLLKLKLCLYTTASVIKFKIIIEGIFQSAVYLVILEGNWSLAEKCSARFSLDRKYKYKKYIKIIKSNTKNKNCTHAPVISERLFSTLSRFASAISIRSILHSEHILCGLSLGFQVFCSSFQLIWGHLFSPSPSTRI